MTTETTDAVKTPLEIKAICDTLADKKFIAFDVNGSTVSLRKEDLLNLINENLVMRSLLNSAHSALIFSKPVSSVPSEVDIYRKIANACGEYLAEINGYGKT